MHRREFLADCNLKVEDKKNRRKDTAVEEATNERCRILPGIIL